MFWNEELQLPQTYILDAHRLDEGEKLPRCVEDCPTQAMHWGDLNDPSSDVSRFVAEHKDEIEDYFPAENGEDYVVRYWRCNRFSRKRIITNKITMSGRTPDRRDFQKEFGRAPRGAVQKPDEEPLWSTCACTGQAGVSLVREKLRLFCFPHGRSAFRGKERER